MKNQQMPGGRGPGFQAQTSAILAVSFLLALPGSSWFLVAFLAGPDSLSVSFLSICCLWKPGRT